MFDYLKSISNANLLRWTILVALCLQNTSYTLFRKYSMVEETVSSKEVLLVGEVLKLVVSLWCIFHDNEDSDSQGSGVSKIFWLVMNSGKMLALAVIYGAMNILSFVALLYIGAGEFTVCAQLKILTTAAFSVALLGTTLSFAKWRALALLVFGCVLVASPSFSFGNSSLSFRDSYKLLVLGYGAVLTEILLSGFASIYFEKVVKSTSEKITIWERNFQLSVFSIILYSALIVYERVTSAQVLPPLGSNWTVITLTVSLLGAGGGLLVAATLKYADAILKTLATSGAIVFATFLGHIFLNGPLNFVIAIGCCIVIYAIFAYTTDSSAAPEVTLLATESNEAGSSSESPLLESDT